MQRCKGSPNRHFQHAHIVLNTFYLIGCIWAIWRIPPPAMSARVALIMALMALLGFRSFFS